MWGVLNCRVIVQAVRQWSDKDAPMAVIQAMSG